MTRADFKKSLSFLLLCFGLIVAVMVTTPTHMRGAYNSFSAGSTLTLAVASPASVPDEIVWSETVMLQPHTTSEVVVSGDQVVMSWQNTTANTDFGKFDATIVIYNGVRLSSPDEQFMNVTGDLKHFSRAAPWVGAVRASKTYCMNGNDLPSTNVRRGTKLNC